MLAKITNFGPPRPFPTYKGDIFIATQTPYKTEDPKVVETLRNFNKRSDIFLKIEIMQPDIDYSKYKIWELRAIASKVGISDSFKMKKSELVARLQERQG